MTGRLWFPQLDVYDAVRRMAGLILFWDQDSPPSRERLCIADFYLANPPLLHKTHMTRDARDSFRALDIKRPDKTFVSYPSAPILFQKMEEMQKQALRTLSGTGLIEVARLLENGIVVPTERGFDVFEQRFVPLIGETELEVAKFLARTFASSALDTATLRRNTGLRRMGH